MPTGQQSWGQWDTARGAHLLGRLDPGSGHNEGLADSGLDVGHGLPGGQANCPRQQAKGRLLAGEQRNGGPQDAALQDGLHARAASDTQGYFVHDPL